MLNILFIKMKQSFWICIVVVLLPNSLVAQVEDLTDIEGNTYKTVQIGTQTWMAENLKSIKYNDNSIIPWVAGNSEWTSLTTPGYCWYNNSENANKNMYGALYNWYVVNTGKICPTGWHVPTKEEWMKLATYINDNGGKLKETGMVHWHFPNEGATNSSGFTALPGGFRSPNGVFFSIREAGFWWSHSVCIECDAFPEWHFNDAWNFSLGARTMGYGNQHDNKSYGFSIRCLKD
jgi:uncharacterized protein (TIGR02145 family)